MIEHSITPRAPEARLLHAPETKVAGLRPDEVKVAGLRPAVDSAIDAAEAFSAFMTAFEAFRSANDERLEEIENRLSPDPLISEKMARISDTLDRQGRLMDSLALKARRPGTEVFAPRSRAFDSYARTGEGLELKAMSAGADPDGGYLVPEEVATEIGRRLAKLSPIRSVAQVITVSSALYRKPFALTGPATGWVSESAVRTQTASPGLAELQFPTMELYAMPAATQSLLDDAAVNLDEWIAGEIEQAFAEQESAAFVNGNGVNRPLGFMSVPRVAESAWSWGSLGTIATGAEGDFAAAEPGDALIELVYALKSGYRQNAHWVMNRRTQAALRKLKDGDGNYLWQAPAAAGEKAMLMGFPVLECEDMPDIGPGSAAIAFGDFARGYLVVDRAGVRVLRDPYSAKPYVLFYTTKRVGGGVQDFDAIKLLRFAAA